MKLDIFNIDGTTTGNQAELNDLIFGIEPNETVIYEDVRRHMANKRQGTHNTKGRSEVVGSTKKMYRQKGTGNARRGDIKSPLLRKGGTVFGPKPRDYSFKLNKKVIKLARKSALSLKASADAIKVVSDFTFDEPKTSKMAEILSALDLSDKKVLILTPDSDLVVLKSARNLPKIQVLEAVKPSTYDILNADVLLFTESAIPALEQNFEPQNDEVAA